MEYKKDFDEWNKKKKIIDQKETSGYIFFGEREIWWGSLGLNIGYEQEGCSLPNPVSMPYTH